MKLDDILEKLVTIAGIIFVGWYAYNLFFKKDDTSIQPPSLQSEYRVTTNDYQKQQEVSKKSKEECLRIVGDYLQRYGHNVTYIYTTDPSLNNWKYNVKGTITNSDGTTRHFGVLYDYPTKTIRTFDVD